MGRAPAFYLLITLLTYFLILSSAIPISRLQRMPLQETGEMPSVRGNTIVSEMGTKRSVPEDEATISARMAVEMQDYQPSGPNGKHKPPGWR
ncbi:hypothetical protein EJB05_42996 [Eragrostis curvula]|uniref:Uncharacterized protein n=1 Tax=Eragrostis curvula TaxID=38414 RepID=A0A5J9TDQ3_9POAL|nr:hypothetical protein EJB05_42996 [Eragrostis curvula]